MDVMSRHDFNVEGDEVLQMAQTADSAGQFLVETLQNAQAMAAATNWDATEQVLNSALEQLRVARGVAIPKPYRVADLALDLRSASNGLMTGYTTLDKLFVIPGQALSLVAARSGHGKTTLQLNLLARMLETYPELSFAFFSYQENRQALALKLIMLEAGEILSERHNFEQYVLYLKEQRPTHPTIEEAITRYEQWASSGRLLLSDQRLAAKNLAAAIGQLARRTPLGAVFVDHVQRVPLRTASAGTSRPDIQRISDQLRDVAGRSAVPLILGTQLGGDRGHADKLRLNDLGETGDLAQDASLVIGLTNRAKQKEEDYGEFAAKRVDLEILALKNRAGRANARAVLPFDRRTLRILDGAAESPSTAPGLETERGEACLAEGGKGGIEPSRVFAASRSLEGRTH